MAFEKVFAFCLLLAVASAFNLNQPFSGHFTYYNDRGTGACGHYLDASSEMLVAVSYQWFTNPNPNNDPLCNYCLRVDYKGKR